MRHKPSVVLYEEDYLQEKGLKMLKEYFCTEHHMTETQMRDLIVKYPPFLSKTKEQLNATFNFMSKHGIGKKRGMLLVEECPMLVSMYLESQFKEAFFLFELYVQMDEKQVIKIFRGFPYMACINSRKLTKFLGEFKKYRFTHEEIINLCVNSGGLLGSHVSNFKGLFDQLRVYGITAKQVKNILRVLPEFALQNRKDMLRRKIKIIKDESGRDEIYMRNFIKRHPDVIMK